MTHLPRRVLAAVDGSSADVIAVATTAARAYGDDVELHIVHVVDRPPPNTVDVVATTAALIERGRAHLDDALAEGARVFAGPIIGHLATGEPWRETIALARRKCIDLVVVGSSGARTFERWMLGWTAEKIVRHAPCPVLLARPKAVALDDAETAPPCEACAIVQKRTGRQTLFCQAHAHRAEAPLTLSIASARH